MRVYTGVVTVMTTVLIISIVILLLGADILLVDIARSIRAFSALHIRARAEEVEKKDEKKTENGNKSTEELEKEHAEKFKKEQDEAFGVMMNYDIATVYGVGSEHR